MVHSVVVLQGGVIGGLRASARRAGKAATRWLPDRAVDPIRTQAFAFPASEVLRVVAALQSAGVSAWLLGGWGVDALLGRETRRHSDLDIAVDIADGGVDRAVRELQALGYTDVQESRETSRLMPFRVVLRQPSGWTVDLVPIRSRPTTGTALSTRSGDWRSMSEGGDLSVTGQIESTPVPCLSAQGQLRLRQGYRLRRRDQRDLAVLDQLVLGLSDEV